MPSSMALSAATLYKIAFCTFTELSFVAAVQMEWICMQAVWTGCRTFLSCSRTSSGPFKSLWAVQQRSRPLVRMNGIWFSLLVVQDYCADGCCNMRAKSCPDSLYSPAILSEAVLNCIDVLQCASHCTGKLMQAGSEGRYRVHR